MRPVNLHWSMMKQTRACLIKMSGKEDRKRPGAGRKLRKINLLFSTEMHIVSLSGCERTAIFI